MFKFIFSVQVLILGLVYLKIEKIYLSASSSSLFLSHDGRPVTVFLVVCGAGCLIQGHLGKLYYDKNSFSNAVMELHC